MMDIGVGIGEFADHPNQYLEPEESLVSVGRRKTKAVHISTRTFYFLVLQVYCLEKDRCLDSARWEIRLEPSCRNDVHLSPLLIFADNGDCFTSERIGGYVLGPGDQKSSVFRVGNFATDCLQCRLPRLLISYFPGGKRRKRMVFRAIQLYLFDVL